MDVLNSLEGLLQLVDLDNKRELVSIYHDFLIQNTVFNRENNNLCDEYTLNNPELHDMLELQTSVDTIKDAIHQLTELE